MAEKDLYKPVAAFIKREFNCFAVKTTTGTRHGSIDVVGLRDLIGDLGGGTEVIAVEVKPEKSTLLKSLGQAYAYSVMADRCYLAIHKPYRRRVSQEEIDMAAQLNVGLIQIGTRKTCRVLVSSPRQEPLRSHRLALIRKVGYVECVVCGTLFPNTGLRSQRDRSSIRHAIVEEKAFRYWLFELAERRGADKRRYIYDSRYICPDCVQAFRGLEAT